MSRKVTPPGAGCAILPDWAPDPSWPTGQAGYEHGPAAPYQGAISSMGALEMEIALDDTARYYSLGVPEPWYGDVASVQIGALRPGQPQPQVIPTR